ncbi:MAG: hypothetical protein N3B18_12945, partial [Desulfobacterota bacterium]|nr:hypothetical protein [Thermodesulfobacteriota bacterium]
MKTPLHEIATLAGSLETELKTAEIHKSNDFYGFASVLKKYAGVPDTYQIKAAIEHGPLMGNCIWDNDIEAPLPAIFPMSRCRRMFLNKKTDKPVIPIGPVITYAEGYLSMEELRNEKQKLGRTLVAFPAHSTHWIDVAYDIEGYCNFLEELGKSFDTVIVCLYWKDVLRRVAEHYRARGFYCVTAGHIFDPLFMSRLRSIIALADLTTSNEISSVLGYCVLLGKPHYYHEVHTTWHAPSQDILIRDTCGGTGARPFFRWIFDLFMEPMDVVTDRQRDVISYYWGYYDSKTPKEIGLLFQLTEEMYRRKLSHRRDFSMLSLQKTGSDLSKCLKAVFQRRGTADACEGINGKASFQGQQGFFEKEQTQSLHHTSSHYDATQQQFSVKV